MTRQRLILPLFLFATTCTQIAVSAFEVPKDLYRYLATVRTVMNGNTISVNVDLGFDVWKHDTEIRLRGVKTQTVEEDPTKAAAAQRFLHDILKDHEDILIQTYPDPTGKYDGWYAKVSIWDDDEEDWISVNELMIDSEHGTAVE